MSAEDHIEWIDGHEYVLIDSREVDYDLEDELDAELEALNSPKKTLLSKIVNLVSTGTARANIKSDQDGAVFKHRYRYVGGVSENTRDFCKGMIKANKIYRKEDILLMGSQAVNEGWGPEGADTYSIWLYKGGGDNEYIKDQRTCLITGFYQQINDLTNGRSIINRESRFASVYGIKW